MSEAAGSGGSGSGGGIPPNVRLALDWILLGNPAKYDSFKLSEAEWLLTAVLACRQMSLQTNVPGIFEIVYEVDVEDEDKIRKFFDLPVESMGNKTCEAVARLLGMFLIDGEKAFRENRLELANAYLDPRKIVILTRGTADYLHGFWNKRDNFYRDLRVSAISPAASDARLKFATAVRVVLSNEECFRMLEKEKPKKGLFGRLRGK